MSLWENAQKVIVKTGSPTLEKRIMDEFCKVLNDLHIQKTGKPLITSNPIVTTPSTAAQSSTVATPAKAPAVIQATANPITQANSGSYILPNGVEVFIVDVDDLAKKVVQSMRGAKTNKKESKYYIPDGNTSGSDYKIYNGNTGYTGKPQITQLPNANATTNGAGAGGASKGSYVHKK